MSGACAAPVGAEEETKDEVRETKVEDDLPERAETE